MSYENVAIPFLRYGNECALTDAQFMTQTYIREFFERFRHCFVRDDCRDLWLYRP